MTKPNLCRLILHAKDVARLAAWYATSFGWRIAEDLRAEGWITLDSGAFQLALHAGARGARAKAWPKLQIRVDDVAARRAEFVAHGVEMSRIHEWRGRFWSQGEDPEDNVFQIASW